MKNDTSQQDRRKMMITTKIILAGCSNMSAACITNPVDVLKVRMQLDFESSSSALNSKPDRTYADIVSGTQRILKHEGIRGFYKGLNASLMREGSYSAIRLGAYEPTKELLGATHPMHTPLHLVRTRRYGDDGILSMSKQP
jgi:hypothetical protein